MMMMIIIIIIIIILVMLYVLGCCPTSILLLGKDLNLCLLLAHPVFLETRMSTICVY